MNPFPAAPLPPEVVRTTRAVVDLQDRFPVDHLLVPADGTLLRSLALLDPIATTVLMPPASPRELVAHLEASTPAHVDVEIATPPLCPRGSLPALLVLGEFHPNLSKVPLESRRTFDMFSALGTGITALIDPADAPANAPWGWTTVSNRRISAIYRRRWSVELVNSECAPDEFAVVERSYACH